MHAYMPFRNKSFSKSVSKWLVLPLQLHLVTVGYSYSWLQQQLQLVTLQLVTVGYSYSLRVT
jgi:hypothetical protein